MTIDGRLRIFSDSVCLPRAGGKCVASSGGDTEAFCLTFSRDTYWASVGSAQDEVETLTITFREPRRIDSLFLVGHNFKDFSITYGDPAAQFKVKDTLPGAGTLPPLGIAMAGNTLRTSFFEFHEVTTDRINITIFKTFPSNAQKRLTTFAAALLMGQFSGPSKALISVTMKPNNRQERSINNKISMVRGIDSFSASVAMQNTANQNDQWLLEWIFATPDPFIFWACGGMHGDAFAVEARGFNLEDIFRVYATNDYAPRWNAGLYLSGISASFTVAEAI